MREISRRPRASNTHSSTRSAFALKSAKFTPLPSHVAPSGYGRPASTRGRAAITRSVTPSWGEPDRGQRRQGEGHGEGAPVRRAGGGHRATVTQVGSAVRRGVRVDELGVACLSRYAERIPIVSPAAEVADAYDVPVPIGVPADERHDRVAPVVVGDPLEACRLAV